MSGKFGEFRVRFQYSPSYLPIPESSISIESLSISTVSNELGKKKLDFILT